MKHLTLYEDYTPEDSEDTKGLISDLDDLGVESIDYDVKAVMGDINQKEEYASLTRWNRAHEGEPNKIIEKATGRIHGRVSNSKVNIEVSSKTMRVTADLTIREHPAADVSGHTVDGSIYIGENGKELVHEDQYIEEIPGGEINTFFDVLLWSWNKLSKEAEENKGHAERVQKLTERNGIDYQLKITRRRQTAKTFDEIAEIQNIIDWNKANPGYMIDDVRGLITGKNTITDFGVILSIKQRDVSIRVNDIVYNPSGETDTALASLRLVYNPDDGGAASAAVKGHIPKGQLFKRVLETYKENK